MARELVEALPQGFPSGTPVYGRPGITHPQKDG